MTSKEKLQEVWDLIHNKYPDTNEEIQKVRYAVKRAMELDEKDTPKEPKLKKYHKNEDKRRYICPYCANAFLRKWYLERQLMRYCSDCGQKLKW